MEKIIAENFKSHYAKNAIFFSANTIFTYPHKKTPFMNFKDGLDYFCHQVQEVFLFRNMLFAELNAAQHHPDLASCPSKVFLQEVCNNEINIMLGAIQWLTWNKRNNHCSKCGNPIIFVQSAAEKRCHICNLSFFPSLSPAVMILVKKENKLLLARSPHFTKGIYSALAGFIDIGETAEYAAHREVQEEVGLKIKSLQYFGSQSWPFPSSFMIAFTAEYLDGQIVMEPNEIEDAQWFDVNNLPNLPPVPSISRMLINATKKELVEQYKA